MHTRTSLALGLISLLASLATTDVQAQIRVRTEEGVSFALPADLHEIPVPVAKQAGAQDTQMVHAYADASSPGVRVYVTRNTGQSNESLPRPSAEVTQSYSAGFMSGLQKTLQLTELREVTPGAYRPEHSAFSIALAGRASGAELVIASVAFFVRAGLNQVLIVAPSERLTDVQKLAAEVLASSQIEPQAKLEASLFHELDNMSAYGVGRLLGSILGPAVAVLVLGGLLAWLLMRLGTAAKLAAATGCGLTVLLYVIGGVWNTDYSLYRVFQVMSAVLASGCLLVPMHKWLSARQRRA